MFTNVNVPPVYEMENRIKFVNKETDYVKQNQDSHYVSFRIIWYLVCSRRKLTFKFTILLESDRD